MTGSEQTEPRYASWGRRACALLLDWLILVMPFFLLAILVAIAIGPDTNASTDDGAAYGALAGIAAMIAGAFYFTILHGRPSGQTVGKRALKIAVRREGSLEALGYRRASARVLISAFFIYSLLWLPDILWPLWDRRNQAMHDKIAGSVVVRTDS